MDEHEFWSLIERSAMGDEDDPEGQAAALEELLLGRSSEELQAFDRLYRQQLARAYRWDLWGAGYLLQGGMGDDSFDYFCDWLISRGRQQFEGVLADPEALVELAEPEDELEAESLRYAVQKAHERTHGTELPWSANPRPEDPAGDEWDEDELEERFPRIAAAVEGLE